MIHAHRPVLTRAFLALAFAGLLLVAPVAPVFSQPVNATTTSSRAEVAVDVALDQVGTPYRWGGHSPNGFDCSGLTSYAYSQAGVTIPRSSRDQLSGSTRISRSELRPGDLVFFNSPVSHVAMYVGDGEIVESPRSGLTVRVRQLADRTPSAYARP